VESSEAVKMKKYFFFICLGLNAVLWMEELPKLIKIKTFENGTENMMLGLGINSNYGTPGPADICVLKNGNIIILDDENNRILCFDYNFKFLNKFEYNDITLKYLLSNDNRIVIRGSLENSINMLVLNEEFKKTLECARYKYDGSNMNYIFNNDSIYYFNYSAKSAESKYYALKQTPTGIEVLDNDAVIRSFEVVNTNFRRIIFNQKGELIFEGKLMTPFIESRFLTTPVQNGNTLSTVWGEIRIYDQNDLLIKKFSLASIKDDEYTFPHNFDENGYVYTLGKDFINKKINVYKIGPFNELIAKFPQQNNIVTANNINVRVRKEGNTTSDILTYLNNGDLIQLLDISEKRDTIEGRSYYWYKVKLKNELIGWVFGVYIDIDK
jgi:hypothetical protein